ncbi:MAG: outer membrane beta-barrel protein [Planctomycetia bacterium]|nr:outer membrane beta-barrel protein [Planctomycetia bacterium]
MKREILRLTSILIGCLVILAVGAISARADDAKNSVLVSSETSVGANAPETTDQVLIAVNTDSVTPAQSEAVQKAVEETEMPEEEDAEEYEPRTKFGGWIQTGVWGNEYSNPDVENGSVLDNVRNTGWHVQQTWLYLERTVDTGGCGFDWGYRADAMFGVDADINQSWADGSFDGKWSTSSDGYGFAIPKLYLELGMNRWNLKLGKFSTPIGYELCEATDSGPFYSHSYLYTHEPLTHTGGLATFDMNENVSFFFGATTGADTGFGNNYDDYGFLAGASLQVTEKLNFTYAAMWNRVHCDPERDSYALTWDFLGTNDPWTTCDGKEFQNSLVLTWDITERLTYVFHSDYSSFTSSADDTKWYESFGIANYLLYKLTCRMDVGVRMEWFRQNNLMDKTHQTCYEIALGANYKLTEHISLRPEIRYNSIYGNYGAEMFDNGMANTQLSGGCAIIAAF